MTARDFFDNLSETLMGRSNLLPLPRFQTQQRWATAAAVAAAVDADTETPPLHCHICHNPVTDYQLADGDAYVKDSAGNADGEYEHRECGQAMKEER